LSGLFIVGKMPAEQETAQRHRNYYAALRHQGLHGLTANTAKANDPLRVAESLEVPKDRFEAAIRPLMNTPPTPLSDIPRKREPKTKK
jgi:hypothetical protein